MDFWQEWLVFSGPEFRIVPTAWPLYNAYTVAMRLVFMGTPSFSIPVLARLLEVGHRVVGVYTRPDKPAGRGLRLAPQPVKLYAQEHAVPVFQPPSLRRADAIAELASLEPETIVVAAYGRILPSGVLELPPKGLVNIHPSLLPRHRGPSPVVTALLEGDATAGITLMLMDEGMDTGPVLAQRQVPILPQETAGLLTERLFREGAELLVETLPAWEAGRVVPTPQDDAQATLTRLYTKEDGELDWTQPAVALERRLRAFDSWPGCSTRWKGRRLRILEGVVVNGMAAEGRTPGEVVSLVGREGAPVAVATGEGLLGLLRLQPEGKRPQSAEEFLRGYRDFIGSRLPS